ncbi:MAG: amidohydrolase family protein [Candidatus Saccharibacteria bacterium]|nr:amidohydrolase family protein [Pseudorhodobacter sp.]
MAPLPCKACEAVRELDYCINTLGFKGVEVLINVHGAELAAPQFAPVWQWVAQLGVLVMIHPNRFTDGGGFHDHYFSNMIGNLWGPPSRCTI